MISITLKKRFYLLILYVMACGSFNTYAQSVTTASGYAEGYVLKATQQGDIIKVELRFEAQVDGYSGETIYQNLSSKSWQHDFYIDINGTHYSLSQNNSGQYLAPQSLKLTFCYNTQKNPRVGSWSGVFKVTNAIVNSINLALPNLPLITNIPVTQIK